MEVESARAHVEAGHALVAEGRYAEAAEAFGAAAEALAAVLGGGHPEVQEAHDDRLAALEMQGVAGLVAELGGKDALRARGPVPPGGVAGAGGSE